MNQLRRLALIVLTMSPAAARAEGTITLADGNSVPYTKVLKREPHAITVETASGITKISYEKLSQASRDSFGMTEKSAADHLAKLAAQEQAQGEAIKNQPEAQPNDAGQVMPSEDGTQKLKRGPAPRLATIEKVKSYWIRAFPQPRSLDADYHNRRKSYVEFVESIRRGAYDHLAKKAMLEWNISEFERVGDLETASRLRADLKQAETEIANVNKMALERQRIEANKMLAAAEASKADAIKRQAAATRAQAAAADRQADELRRNTDARNREADYTRELNSTLQRMAYSID